MMRSTSFSSGLTSRSRSLSSSFNSNPPSQGVGLPIYGSTDGTMETHSGRAYDACTKLGLREQQEDRIVMCTQLFHKCSVIGLFDGTVGDSASEFLQKNLISTLLHDPSLVSLAIRKDLVVNTSSGNAEEYDHMMLIDSAIRRTFHSLDEAYLEKHNNDIRNDYTCSTGVIALLWDNTLTIGHVGDSKACLGAVNHNDVFTYEWLTEDHKPDIAKERARIHEAGGVVVRLHGDKPYIRGGDFFQRHSLGDRPKQLNYSRAFGGKGLKGFGLIVEPDIKQLELTSRDKFVIIGSDGLWDCVEPRYACQIVLGCWRQGTSAAEVLVNKAIEIMPFEGVADNVSAVVVYLNDYDDAIE